MDVIAPAVALATQHVPSIPYPTLHIATERKSVYELTHRQRLDVRPANAAPSG